MSKYCMNCGKELPDDANFCINCGFNFNEPVHQTIQQSSEQRVAGRGFARSALILSIISLVIGLGLVIIAINNFGSNTFPKNNSGFLLIAYILPGIILSFVFIKICFSKKHKTKTVFYSLYFNISSCFFILLYLTSLIIQI